MLRSYKPNDKKNLPASSWTLHIYLSQSCHIQMHGSTKVWNVESTAHFLFCLLCMLEEDEKEALWGARHSREWYASPLATTQDRWKKSRSYFFQEYSVLDFYWWKKVELRASPAVLPKSDYLNVYLSSHLFFYYPYFTPNSNNTT